MVRREGERERKRERECICVCERKGGERERMREREGGRERGCDFDCVGGRGKYYAKERESILTFLWLHCIQPYFLPIHVRTTCIVGFLPFSWISGPYMRHEQQLSVNTVHNSSHDTNTRIKQQKQKCLFILYSCIDATCTYA